MNLNKILNLYRLQYFSDNLSLIFSKADHTHETIIEEKSEAL
jgi:hypothetical protein